MAADPRALLHQSHRELPSEGGTELHPAWPRLTDDQRKAVNEVWDDTVIPALEEADRMRRRMEDMQLEVQDAQALARRTQEYADQRAASERIRRRELHRQIAALETRVLELEGMELSDAA